MAYKWTDTDTIQAYLDAVGGTMRIGGNEDFSEITAQIFENEAVFEIITILSAAWQGIEKLAAADISDDLKRLAAKLTASRLGTVRVSGTHGQLPEWVKSYRNQVFEQTRYMVINFKTVEIQGAQKRDVEIGQILLVAKQRGDVWNTDGS